MLIYIVNKYYTFTLLPFKFRLLLAIKMINQTPLKSVAKIIEDSNKIK